MCVLNRATYTLPEDYRGDEDTNWILLKKTAVLAIDWDGHYCQAWSIFCSVLDKRYTFNRFYRMKAAYIHYTYVYMYIYIHIYIYIYIRERLKTAIAPVRTLRTPVRWNLVQLTQLTILERVVRLECRVKMQNWIKHR